MRWFLPVLSGAFLFGCAAQQQATTVPPPPPVSESSVERHAEVQIVNAEGLNTEYDDFAPLPRVGGRLLFLTSNRAGSREQDIYSAVRSGSSWGNITSVAAVNSSDNDGTATISTDGQTMYFAAINRSGGYGDADIWMSELRGGTWSEPKNLGPVVNSSHWESQPTLSPDGRTLYFASDRPGGKGGRDLWKTTKGLNGEWMEPENLGDEINTPFDEITPSIAQDGSTLYFSSNGHPSLGGFDVFVSRHTSNGWGKPRNLGTPVNSSADEFCYVAQPGTKYAYFASDRTGGKGALDIYTAYPNPARPEATTIVSGHVYDAKTHNPIGAKVTISELRTGKSVATFRSDDLTGEYAIILPAGHSYNVTADAPDHLFYSDRFDVPAQLNDDREVTEDIELQSTTGSVRLLVYFDFNKATLTDESTAELARLIAYMKETPTMRVELDGHTDNVGSHEYNMKLSLDRANAVRDYLAQHGVEESRIVAKGFGFDRPVASNDTDDGRAKNRRVEFHILSE